MGTCNARSLQFRFAKGVALLCCLAILAITVGCEASKGPDAPHARPVPVLFDASVTYAEALRGMTDLGIQPALFCEYRNNSDSGNGTDLPWLPAGQRDRFQQDHLMWVIQTITASADWSYKVYRLPGFHKGPSSQDAYCSGSQNSASPPLPTGNPNLLTYEQAFSQSGAYVYVTFASGVDYDTALYDISNLGLRLADPCYEQSFLPHQQRESWHPMGQEITFSYSHALVVAPAPLISATVWRDQLRKLPDVAEEISYHPVC